jgi:2-polyprenyl-6-methoxyphenol hydroxylase-like FAD-dependent oxidoreductase
MAEARRILIVGGGIGGLSAAIALRKAGFQPHVFEQAAELREVGTGVGIWANCLASLDALGVGEAVREWATPIRKLTGANARGRTLTAINLDDLGAEFQQASCHIVLRPLLLAALARKVPAVTIHTGCRIVRAETLENGARLHFRDGHTEEGDVVVGADGLYSMVRPAVVATDALRYSGQTCFRGVARLQVTELDVLREVQGSGQRGAVCPVNAEVAYWWVALNAARGTRVPLKARRAYLLERFAGWPFGLPEAIAATPRKVILQNDLLDRAPVRQYVKGRIVLMGDAAHPTTPNLGQGANMAIDDAIVLARCLRDSATIELALAAYQSQRLERTTQIVRKSWGYGRACLWTSPLAVKLREQMVRWVPRRMLVKMLRWQILENVGTL